MRAREAGVVADRGEVLVRLRVLAEALVGVDGGEEVLECRVGLARARVEAREVVEESRVTGLRLEALLHHPFRRVPAAGLDVRRGREGVLPRGDLVRLSGLTADSEHGGVIGQRDSAPLQGWIPDEDELTRVELVLVAVDRESHTTAQDEVDLLVLELRFRVFLDDLPADTRRVRVGAERPDAEVSAHRPPDEAFRHLDRIELVDVHQIHVKASPTVPPTTKTIVPAGASASSSPTVNLARPHTTA